MLSANLRLSIACLVVLLCCGGEPTSIHESHDFEGLDAALELGWSCLGRYDSIPHVLVLTDSALTCGADAFGVNRGWYTYLGGAKVCVSGLTVTASLVYVAHYGMAWHDEAFEHEMLHAAQYRVGVVDTQHLGPDWQPGGKLEMCNLVLSNAGY